MFCSDVKTQIYDWAITADSVCAYLLTRHSPKIGRWPEPIHCARVRRILDF